MKIGVWLGDYKNPEEGGGYSYIDRLVKGIDDYHFSSEIEICFITEGKSVKGFKKEVITLQYNEKLKITFKEKIKCRIPVGIIKNGCQSMIQMRYQEEKLKSYKNQLKENGIRIIYYLHQCQCVIPDFPFIVNNWDIGHCSTFTFPEVSSLTEYKYRSEFYNNVITKALFIFAESNAGKDELVKYTRINPQRIKIVPIFAGECVKHTMAQDKESSFLKNYKLERNKFFFYPAQLWAHKNHIGLIEAFGSFSQTHPDYKLVLTGSDKGTLEHVKRIVCQLGVKDSVLYLGFVSTEEMNALYRNATSLIMATYFGPTNMPPLEALELGCPIICSDLAGHREELGDAAIYFNPMAKEELVNAMIEMVGKHDNYLQKTKIQAQNTIFKLDNALKAINKNLCEASIVRNCWE